MDSSGVCGVAVRCYFELILNCKDQSIHLDNPKRHKLIIDTQYQNKLEKINQMRILQAMLSNM